MEDREIHWEEIQVANDQLVGTVKRLVHDRNVRRIILRNDEGHTILEIPLTVEVSSAMLLPVWAGLGAIAGLVGSFTIVVERMEPATDDGIDEHMAHAT